MSYTPRDGIRDTLTVGCAMLMVYVGVQLRDLSRVLAERFARRETPLVTVIQAPGSSMATTVTTSPLPGETAEDVSRRHWAMVEIAKHGYEEHR